MIGEIIILTYVSFGSKSQAAKYLLPANGASVRISDYSKLYNAVRSKAVVQSTRIKSRKFGLYGVDRTRNPTLLYLPFLNGYFLSSIASGFAIGQQCDDSMGSHAHTYQWRESNKRSSGNNGYPDFRGNYIKEAGGLESTNKFTSYKAYVRYK